MPIRDPSLVQEWYQSHPETTSEDIFLWTDLADQTDAAYLIGFDYEDWPPYQSGPAPDLVKYVSLYGYIRLRLYTWKLPIDLSPEEMKRWRAAGYFVEKLDFEDALASVAGGFLDIAGRNPATAVQAIGRQLESKLSELESLADLPIEDYTPEYTSPLLRAKYTAKGITGEQLEDAIDEAMIEYSWNERQGINEPFVIREELECFAWGFEKLRLIAVSEHNEELGLPNPILYEALMHIDLNALHGRLHHIDLKLKRILSHLASYDYFKLDADVEPQRFWWRHWKRQSRRRS
jgi:hypothetical protein